jgi:hypothetical protein
MAADQRTESVAVVATMQLIAGSAMVVVAGFATAALIPGAEPVKRVLAIAIASGVLAALLTDWRACLGVTATAVLVFVAVQMHGSDVEPGATAPWPYTPLLVLATMLGFGYGRMIASEKAAGLQPSKSPPDEIDPNE